MHVHTCTRTSTWVYTCTSTCTGCRCTHKCISISPKKLLHPTSKAKDKASAMLKSVTKQYARTVHITPCILNHVSGASSTRETTYVIAPRDNVRDRLERQRTWSPQETTYVTPRETTRQRDCEAARQLGCKAARQWGCQRARERVWSPWSQCHRVWTGVVKGSELFTTRGASWRLVIVTRVLELDLMLWQHVNYPWPEGYPLGQ